MDGSLNLWQGVLQLVVNTALLGVIVVVILMMPKFLDAIRSLKAVDAKTALARLKVEQEERESEIAHRKASSDGYRELIRQIIAGQDNRLQRLEASVLNACRLPGAVPQHLPQDPPCDEGGHTHGGPP